VAYGASCDINWFKTSPERPFNWITVATLRGFTVRELIEANSTVCKNRDVCNRLASGTYTGTIRFYSAPEWGVPAICRDGGAIDTIFSTI
jgi:hypothetical protein